MHYRSIAICAGFLLLFVPAFSSAIDHVDGLQGNAHGEPEAVVEDESDNIIESSPGASASNPRPVINSITPKSGYEFGGDTLTIRGANFSEPVTVRVGGALCGNLVVSDGERQITCTTPRGQLGPASVTVLNSFGRSRTRTRGHTYRSVKNGDVISGLTISNASGPCMQLAEPQNVTIENNAIGPCRTSAIVIQNGDGVTVRNNLIHDTGSGSVFGVAADVAAIVIGGGQNVTIASNRLERVHGGVAAIGTRGDIRVEFNEILDVFGLIANEPPDSAPGMYEKAFGGGVAIALREVSGENNIVVGNVNINEYELSTTADLIGLVDSSGVSLSPPVLGAHGEVISSAPILIKGNWVEGGVERSAVGINLGDFGGRNQFAAISNSANASLYGNAM